MSLIDQGKVVLEISLNEATTKEQNPNVPYGPDAVAEDVIRCFQAGATMVHFHARTDEGDQVWVDPEPSRRVLEKVAGQGVDPLIYPSYVGAQLDHIWALTDPSERPSGLVLSPFDPAQHEKSTFWDVEKRSFLPEPFREDASSDLYPGEIDELQSRGIIPKYSVFTPTDLRWVSCAGRAGILKQPINLNFFYSDSWLSQTEPSVELLALMQDLFPKELAAELVVVPYLMSSRKGAEVLLERALELGMGIRVGVGDCPHAFTTETNEELTEWAVELIRKKGLEPATPTEFRDVCGLPPFE
ncbi:MAG: 3-keto-5-aminohexanoate cleavage protein [Deltaproteobacteria bacterium]|jgi:uncharacterized protein (DUF849 family)|nr:3-keto-5-aminohexanoate cleavage protein [Deltaproteobacteria bacterium]